MERFRQQYPAIGLSHKKCRSQAKDRREQQFPRHRTPTTSGQFTSGNSRYNGGNPEGLEAKRLDTTETTKAADTMKLVRSTDLEFVPAAHEDPRSPGSWKKVMLRKNDLQTGAVQMVNWSRMPVGKSFAAHYHEDMQEIFIIVQGDAEMKVGDETVSLSKGDTITIDAGEVHRMWNRGSDDLDFIAIGIAGDKNGKTVVV